MFLCRPHGHTNKTLLTLLWERLAKHMILELLEMMTSPIHFGIPICHDTPSILVPRALFPLETLPRERETLQTNTVTGSFGRTAHFASRNGVFFV